MIDLQCLKCRGSLGIPEENVGAPSLECDTCSARFPLIDDVFPVLVDDPGAYLAIQFSDLFRTWRQWTEMAHRLNEAVSQGAPRALFFRRAIQALEKNREWISALMSEIRPYIDPEAMMRAQDKAPDLGGNFTDPNQVGNYLTRDWGGAPVSEDEIAVAKREIVKRLERHSAARDSALILGAGTGRLAEELRSEFRQVTAIDLSFLMASAYHIARREPLEFYRIRQRNPRTADSQVVKVRAEIPELSGENPLVYAIADAGSTPFPDQSFSTIISVYFTDVIPLSHLMPEVCRILRPEGSFVHFGPLSYHFDQLQEKYSAEELLERFRETNFEIRHPGWVSNTQLRTAESSMTFQVENLVFVARREPSAEGDGLGFGANGGSGRKPGDVLTVDDIMTSPVVSVGMDADLEEIRDIFEHYDFHHLPVVSESRVVGVVSDRDLLANLSPFLGRGAERPADVETLRRKAHQIMTRKPATVIMGTPLVEAAAAMRELRVNCLPVIDEYERLRGILTTTNVIIAVSEGRA